MIHTEYLTLSAGTNTFTYKIGNQLLWLLGVNLEVTDSGGNPKRNVSGSVWVQSPNLANVLSLCHGNLRNGQIAGYGCMPLADAKEIIGTVYHAGAGDIGKLNLYLADESYAKKAGLVLNPNWSVRPDVSTIIQHGKLVIVSASGAATAQTCDIRPSDGYLWEILSGWMYHDDGSARNLGWRFYDGTTTITTPLTTNTAANTKLYLYMDQVAQDAPSWNKTLLSYDVYMQAYASAALSAGKKLFFEGLALEYAE